MKSVEQLIAAGHQLSHASRMRRDDATLVSDLVGTIEAMAAGHLRELNAYESTVQNQACRIEALAAELAKAKALICAVREVSYKSTGIAGMRLDGAIAEWETTLPGLYSVETPVADEVLTRIRTEAASSAMAKAEALAAEGAQMLRLLTDISENHVEYYSEGEGYMFAGVPLDYVSEINSYVSRDVNAENPFTDTDAVIADMRDTARNELYQAFVKHARLAGLSDSDTVSVFEATDALLHCAEQLRSGKGAAS